MKTNRFSGALAVMALGLVTSGHLAGCAAPEGRSADGHLPDVADDDVRALAQITVNGWTLNAQTPTTGPIEQNGIDYASGGASFSNPQGGTAKMGLCLLRKVFPQRTCTSAANCPLSRDPDGTVYCTNVNNTGTKYCFERPGTQSAYCAGSPANGGAPIGAGAYWTPWQPAQVSWGEQTWISYACFAGCATTDPSVSSAAVTEPICSNGQFYCE